MNNELKQQFREDEVAVIRFWDKQRNEWISNVFPKIGGRLRLAHEQNEAISIETEIYKYDESLAVVIGTCRTAKGSFKGIGMSSVERDQRIAPAILELAETRSIARALRFAGFGVEYCSAEEVSHLENGNGAPPRGNDASRPELKKQIEHQPPALPAPVNNVPVPQNNENAKAVDPPPEARTGRIEVSFEPVETSATIVRPQFKAVETESPAQGNQNKNGNGSRQMSQKQFEYIRSMGRKLGLDLEALSQGTIEIFNRELAHLTAKEASTFIDHIQAGYFRKGLSAV